VTDGAGDGYRQFPPGVVIAEQNVRNGVTSLLTEIPTFENDGHALAQIGNGKRSAVEQEDDYGCACLQNCFYQLLLKADHLETCAITEMGFGPAFARSLLVAADGENDNIGL